MARTLQSIFGTVTTLIAAGLIFSISPAADSKPQECGDSASFTLSKDGVLTVTGSGEMYDIDPARDNNDSIVFYKDKDNVKKIVIGEGITSIGSYNFSHMKNLKTLVLPSTLTRIGSFAFYDDEKLGNVSFPAELQRLEQSCFGFCKAMTEVKIPSKVNHMDETFFGNPKISKVSVEGTAETLTENGGYYAPFRECYALKTILVSDSHPYLYVKDGVLYNKENNDLIQYPLGNRNTDFRIPAETTKVKSASIAGAQYLDLLIVDHECRFEEGAVAAGTWADRVNKVAIFANKGSGAYKFYRKASKNAEDYYAFFELKRLKKVLRSGSILYEKAGGSKVTYLHNSDFKVADLKIDDTVRIKGKTYKITSIEEGCFMNSDSLFRVTLGKNIKKVGKNAFKKSNYIMTVKVPRGKIKAYKKILKKAGLSKRVSIV